MRPKCAKFRLKIRVCDVCDVCDGGSPAQMRIIFLKKFEKKNFENTANFGSICEVYFANGPKIRRVSEIFFADEKNYSQLRIIRFCVAFSPANRRRICDGDPKSKSHLRIFSNFSVCDRIFAQKTKNLQKKFL